MLKLFACAALLSVAADSRADRWGWGVHYTHREDAHSLVPGFSGSHLERRIHPNVMLALAVDSFEGSEHPSSLGSSIGSLGDGRASRSMLRSHLAIGIGGNCNGTDLFVQLGAGVVLEHVLYTIDAAESGPLDDGTRTWRPLAHVGGGFRHRITGTPFSVGMQVAIHSLFGEAHRSGLVMDPPSFDTRAAELSVLVSVHP
jgi:hypothetical protein